ncbi:phage protease [Paraburkholderia adhaesiva]|uniref:phage protease n=1 Tax=Paraburkholderia adhaesiva TaxID=2883244 RepID=UPI001F2AD364|nr:phage protease [Paraburkholderia adhaesiva]
MSHRAAAEPRVIKLSEGTAQTIRVLSAIEELSTTSGSWVTLTRTGTFTDPRYGTFTITPKMLQDMIANFEAGVVGQDIFIDVAHCPSNGAAAKVLKLAIDGDRLRGQLDWTPFGRQAVRERGFRYLSLEYSENWRDNEKGDAHGPVMLGAGLTVRPVIKNLEPIMLAEDVASEHAGPLLLQNDAQSILLSEITNMWKQLIERLRKFAQERKLSEIATDQLIALAEASLKPVTDEKQATVLIERFEGSVKTLAEAQPTPTGGARDGQPAANVGGSTLTEEDVRRILSETHEQREEGMRQLVERRTANVRQLQETIDGANGIDEALRRELFENIKDLVTAEMKPEQVRKLAEAQIASGNRLVAARQLANMGFVTPTGNVRVQVVDDSSRRLADIYRDQLRRTGNRDLVFSDQSSSFITKVLAQFDANHASEVDAEVRLLSSGGPLPYQTDMQRTNLPVGFQREVIRQALQDLNILELVQTLTDFNATATTQIPYEERDTSELYGDGVVFEGSPIPRASINQKMDLAYVLPMKLGLLITNEVVYFTRNGPLDWDAMARNIWSNSRIMRERIARRITNELQRASDAYLAADVTDEAVQPDASGLIKTAKFPIVRPYQAYDLSGNAVSNPQNPVTLKIGGEDVSPYDGSGTQDAGLYYRLVNVNLGYVQLVDQTGAAAAGAAGTMSYSSATNIAKVDLDVPNGSTQEKQLNKVLQTFGARKAMLNSQRFVTPDYCLMSPTLNDTATNAEQFYAFMQKTGTDTDKQGDLQSIKGVPAYGTNAPNIDLGDERILIGQRNLLGYVVTKPWSMTEPFQAVDPATGRAVGKLQAYGEEYNAIKIPQPLQKYMTSVLVYSFSNR